MPKAKTKGSKMEAATEIWTANLQKKPRFRKWEYQGRTAFFIISSCKLVGYSVCQRSACVTLARQSTVYLQSAKENNCNSFSLREGGKARCFLKKKLYWYIQHQLSQKHFLTKSHLLDKTDWKPISRDFPVGNYQKQLIVRAFNFCHDSCDSFSLVCLQPVFFSKGHLDARAYTSVLVVANAKERYSFSLRLNSPSSSVIPAEISREKQTASSLHSLVILTLMIPPLVISSLADPRYAFL